MVFTRIKNEINLYLCNKKWKKMHPESKINFATPIDLKSRCGYWKLWIT